VSVAPRRKLSQEEKKMSKAVFLVFVLVLLGTAGAAQVPEISKAPAPDPVLMAALAVEIFGGGVSADSLCSAAADCSPDPSISCSTSVEGESCEAVDRNCSEGQRGYVRCGSNYTYCPTPCPECTENAFRDFATGFCCEDGRREWYRERCIGGEWVFSAYVCRFFCPYTPP
jgi:hypothetical protein